MLTLGLLFIQNVEYVECNQEHLKLLNEQMVYDIDFFNIVFYEENNRFEACRYLKEAEMIALEEEPSALNAYYIYVDGKLLQEILVEKGLGKQNINYVDYLYSFEKEEQKVLLNYHDINRNNRSIYILGIVFLFVLLSLGAVFMSKV